MAKVSHKKYLRVQDAIDVMRAISDIRDLKSDPKSQRDLITSSAVEITRARHGFSVVFQNLTPDGDATPTRLVGAGESQDAIQAFLETWAAFPPVGAREDPLVDQAARAHAEKTVQLTGLTMPQDRIDDNRLFLAFYQPMGIHSVCAVTVDTSGPAERLGHRSLGIATHRVADQKPFSRRELARLELFNDELQRLYNINALTCVAELDQPLTPRQRQIASLFLQGLAAKQIARHLGLSTHTVYTYCKDLYRRLGVTDRHEAVARLTDEPALLNTDDPAAIRIA